MKAILVRQFGGPEVLRIEEAPVPEPAAGQALVRLHAAGVNPYDTYMRSGGYARKPGLPYTPGSDGAGVVEAVGEGVRNVRPGDRVYTAQTVTGAYAQYALALEEQVWPLPASLSFSQGAGVWIPYGTAYHALHHWACARAGESALVHGASGGVGTAAVQMARAMGLRVFGTAGTPQGRDLVAAQGAALVFDHRQAGYEKEMMDATGGRGVDVVLEMLANVNLARDMKLLASGGRIIVIGSRGEIVVDPRDLMMRRASVMGFTLWQVTPQEESEIHAGLQAGLANGTLRPVVGRELPLAQAPKAHELVLEPGALGKIVLLPYSP